MTKLSTRELEYHIKAGYKKLEKEAEKDEIYIDLDIIFTDKLPIAFQGKYGYSDHLGYHYVGIERGIENMHRITDSLFEISYWIYEHLTFLMASKYELKHRVENQDSRRGLFKKQLELLELIDINFRKRVEIDIDETLKEAPYDDTTF